MPRLVACSDKLRGSASAAAACSAIASAAWDAGWDADELPMSDGGEGFLDVIPGGSERRARVTGPLGSPVDAVWKLRGRTAFVEAAQACGLAHAGGAEGNDPMRATTAGVGELVLAALGAGARRVVVGLGGSATTDGGLGALEAIGSPARLRGVELVVACDVQARFTDAARLFSVQKGATPAQARLLERRLQQIAGDLAQRHGVDVGELPGAGAAGGLAGGLAALGGKLVAGIDLVAQEVGLADAVEGADLVVTGEGLLDAESFDGKVVGGVEAIAADAGVPVLVVAGEVDAPGLADVERADAPGRTVVSLVERFGREASLREPLRCITRAVAEDLARRGG